jgi:hypothetical protein
MAATDCSGLLKLIRTCPPITAAWEGAAPAKGTWVSSTPAMWANSAGARWLVLPTPAEL